MPIAVCDYCHLLVEYDDHDRCAVIDHMLDFHRAEFLAAERELAANRRTNR